MDAENRHRAWALAARFPEPGQRRLQAVGPGTLHRRIKLLGELGDPEPPPTGDGLGVDQAPRRSPLLPGSEPGLGLEEPGMTNLGFFWGPDHSVVRGRILAQ